MKRAILIAVLAAFLGMGCSTQPVKTVWLDEMDLSTMETGWGSNHVKKSVDRNPLTINGTVYERGVGTHAISKYMVDLGGKGRRFLATVGVDDEVKGKASLEFFVLGDKKILWQSGIMTDTTAALPVDVDIRGVKKLALLVTDGGDNINFDHANWAEARFEIRGDTILALPQAVAGEPYILTPPVGDAPRINGPSVTGATPGRPFMYKIPVTGKRPMTIIAANLPAGLSMDPATGVITGKVKQEGEYLVDVRAKNEAGEAARTLKIIIGKHKLALTPPMGWNSWNNWACAVDQEKVKASADAMVSHGLIEHGWSYINIDDCWQSHERTKAGELLPNEKFPDIKGLADHVHSLGLKIGIYSSPGPTTCAGYPGSYKFELRDAQTWANWGMDYIKYDWCGYSRVVEDNTLEAYQKPYRVMREALDRVDRDIVYSLCQYGMKDVSAWGAEVGGDLWRTTGDIGDSWNSLSSIGFAQDKNSPYAGPSAWNDPDMLVLGYVGWGASLSPTRLTPDEQYSHISLWSLLAAPLLLGCDMERLDDFTLNLITNDEVIAVNQDALGKQAVPLVREDGMEVWVKELEDGSKAAGVFYTGSSNTDPVEMFNWDEGKTSRKITVDLASLGFTGKCTVRDLWRQQELGAFTGTFDTEVPFHGVTLVKITATE